MSEFLTLAPILIPSALLLWLLKGQSDLKALMAREVEKSDNIEDAIKRIDRTKHDHANKIQELSARVDILEWRFTNEGQ